MCLENVQKVNLVTKRNARKGYKVVIRRKPSRNYYRGFYFSSMLIPGKWITDLNKGVIPADSGETYTSGFHFYSSKRDAIMHCSENLGEVVFEVRGAGIITTGDNSGKTYVAKQIKLLKQVYPPVK